MKIRFSAAVAAAALVLTQSAVCAADLDKGRAKAEAVCAACHGKDGNTPIDPSYPRLAGQHQDFLLQALGDYKSDRRKNAIMGAQAKTLSKQDMEDLALYYSKLPGTLTLHR